ncbi:DUF4843 domain-containing protein [Flaviaesturariibacter aridisoli]|uniref:DUF4843 domain-containing protein n=1 Tax=Flaviaesturariibacter aridisoli TaxID=2545761 RepID=A0A4R4DYT8_9BACT|nr:DUF4843 domain-containing protein [Flaviaesturariibacter aridisoli]TCZ71007.1 DUF4843 domain-containing protein [Flaviaesturariibacter aridisoli]
MKQFKAILPLLLAVATFSACTKNEDKVFDSQPLVEWDAATYNARTSGYPFPLLTRVPQAYGRNVFTSATAYGAPADPALTRLYVAPAPATTTDTVTMRVNLVGPQMDHAQTFAVSVEPNFSTAVEGTHYMLIDRTVTIPAHSSFGYARWRVLNPGPLTPGGIPTVNVVFQLSGNSEVLASENYKYIGWGIAQ